MIKAFLAVGLGGAFGSMLRYGISLFFARWNPAGFPWATLLANLNGCFLIGLFMAYATKEPNWDSNMRLLAITGFCGGYTTFSTFAFENVQFIKSGQLGLALAYTLGSLVFGGLLVYLGMQFK